MKNNDLIFIVEDDQFYADALESFLQSLGYTNIETYNTGASCLANRYKMPKMVLLDYNLSDRKGESVLLELIAFDSNIPVVFVSGQDSIQLAVDTLKYGAFDYIQKDSSAFEKLKEITQRINLINKSVRVMKQKSLRKRIAFGALTISFLAVVFILAL